MIQFEAFTPNTAQLCKLAKRENLTPGFGRTAKVKMEKEKTFLHLEKILVRTNVRM